MAETVCVGTHQLVRNLLKNCGPGTTYESVQNALREEGRSVTRADYEAAWRSLFGGEDAKGAKLKPPGAMNGQPAPARPEPPRAATTESVPAPRFGPKPDARLSEIVRELGPDASDKQIQERAAAEGLECSQKKANRYHHAAFPGHRHPPDPLQAVLDVRRQLAELRRVVEAAGGTLTYRLEVTVSEEVG